MDVATLDREIPASVADTRVEVGDLGVRVLRKGEGPPLLVVHDSLGNLGWLPLYERLAARYSVVVPDVPGYGRSDRPDWARNPRDLAVLVLQLLDKLGLDGVTLVGVGFGGFLAAEMATMHQTRFDRLVLVGPTGLHTREGEVTDQMLMGFAEYGLTGFRDARAFEQVIGAKELPPDVYELWDFGTEMTARVCWKPWMYSDQLPHLLREVRVPALIVCGEQDRLVPLDVGRQYGEILPDARVEVLPAAGHFVDLEEPDRLAELIEAHAGADGR
jgi:pimeloyl-ACP methyl ester carboxylesterase